MVPMHLGSIDNLFVPHNLISAQESPVALLKFQGPGIIHSIVKQWRFYSSGM